MMKAPTPAMKRATEYLFIAQLIGSIHPVRVSNISDLTDDDIKHRAKVLVLGFLHG
jgi:hypothetical protein